MADDNFPDVFDAAGANAPFATQDLAAMKRLLDGRYEIVAVLGGGGTAIVYLARHHALHRDVAIKVIRPEVFESERELERYVREARIIASLNHPNIVTLHDVGKLGDGRPYMVMEYVNGQSLNRLLSHDATLPFDTALAVFEQVARALGHAHRNGIVHRDIKPGNILLRQRSTGYPMVKVADFGVASVASASTTHQGAFIGTPMYMSPEQAQGLPVSPASDIYSLGIVMYRALTGRKPFEAESPVALAMCHVTDPVPPMQGEGVDIPPDLEAVVLRCLEKDPADRYQTADKLLEALTEVHLREAPHLMFLSQESLDASTSGALRITPVQAEAPTFPAWKAAVAVLTLIALGIGMVVGWAAAP